MKRTKLVWVGMLCASAAVGAQTDCTAKDSNVECIRPCAMRMLPLGSVHPAW